MVTTRRAQSAAQSNSPKTPGKRAHSVDVDALLASLKNCAVSKDKASGLPMLLDSSKRAAADRDMRVLGYHLIMCVSFANPRPWSMPHPAPRRRKWGVVGALLTADRDGDGVVDRLSGRAVRWVARGRDSYDSDPETPRRRRDSDTPRGRQANEL